MEYQIVFIDFLRRDSIHSNANLNEDPFMTYTGTCNIRIENLSTERNICFRLQFFQRGPIITLACWSVHSSVISL